MAHQSVTCVVFDGEKVLLQLREDFRIWGFPGGGVEPGERWEDAAVRETWEETGYQTELVRLVGEYTRPDYLPGEVKYVSSGRVIGGEARPDPRESLEVRWFPVDALPRRSLPGSDHASSMSATVIGRSRTSKMRSKLTKAVMTSTRTLDNP